MLTDDNSTLADNCRCPIGCAWYGFTINLANRIQIHVEIPTRKVFPKPQLKTITVDVWSCDYIGNVKRIIHENEGFSFEGETLVYEGRCLGDHETVSECQIQRGSTIKAAYYLLIFVKLPSGKMITVDAWSCDSMKRVKEKVQEKTGIPTEYQRLRTVGDIGLSESETFWDFPVSFFSGFALILEPSSEAKESGYLLFKSPFPKLPHFLDPTPSFSDADFVIPGLDEPLHFHRSVIAHASDSLKALLEGKRSELGSYAGGFIRELRNRHDATSRMHEA